MPPSCILDEYYSRDVLGAINASSIYVQTWFRISWLNDSPQCRSKAFCMAESEVADLSSPIAEVLAEIYRYMLIIMYVLSRTILVVGPLLLVCTYVTCIF